MSITEITDWIFDHEVEDIIAEGKALIERNKLVARQKKNRYYRSLIKDVKFKDKACIVHWNDGTVTKALWDNWEGYDPEKAILVAIARKHFGGTGIYNEILQKYGKVGWDEYDRRQSHFAEKERWTY